MSAVRLSVAVVWVVAFAAGASSVRAATGHMAMHGNLPPTIAKPTVTISVRLPDHQGTMRLFVEPRVPDGSCSQLVIPMGRLISVSTSCGPSGSAPGAIEVFLDVQRNIRAPHQAIWFLRGQLGVGVSSLFVRYRTGARQRVPIHHGWVLYQVGARTQPTELIARNQQGKVIATESIGQ